MRAVVLTRNPRGIASRFLARNTALPEVELVAVLLDEGRIADRRRHLWAKARKLWRVGPTALPVGLALRRAYAPAGSSGVPLLEHLSIPVQRVPTLNGPQAQELLRALDPDLAVSLDNSLLAESTFSIPRLGTINVHHGSVPEYRGGPPVFWELADGCGEVGFVVHRIDRGIDTGAVLARGEIPIERRGTLAETLAATIPRLHEASLGALERVLVELAQGGAREEEQRARDVPARTTPTLGAYLRVRRSLRA